MYSLSFIGFGLVLWLTLEASRRRGELDSSLTLLDMGLYFFALAKVITEVCVLVHARLTVLTSMRFNPECIVQHQAFFP